MLAWFSYSYGKKCMVVDSLLEYKGPPNCVQYRVWSRSIKLEDVVQ